MRVSSASREGLVLQPCFRSLSPSLTPPVSGPCQLYLGFPIESVLSLLLFDRRSQLWFNVAFGELELFFFSSIFSLIILDVTYFGHI